MRIGVRLGVDAGRARIGVARSDPQGLLATPVETIPRDPLGGADMNRLLELVAEHEAMEIVVGLPLNLRGEHTPSTSDAITLSRAIAAGVRAFPSAVSVRLVDERLSTVTAQSQLRQAGRSVKRSRAQIDQAAAVVILQHALDMERSRGIPPGELVEPPAAPSPEQEGAST